MASITIASTWSPPSASLSLLTRSTKRNASFVNLSSARLSTRSGLLYCSFTAASTSLCCFTSSFSGLSLGLDLNSKVGAQRNNSRRLVITAAGRAALCLTKRSRSRKSLARTHGFRRRMRTTSGRAVIKRRRAKGRKVLCTKTHPNSGK